MSKLSEDPRIDPRIKAGFANMPEVANPGDAASREQRLCEYFELLAWSSVENQLP